MSTHRKIALPILLGVIFLALAGVGRADDDNGGIFDRVFNKNLAHSFAGTWDTVTLDGVVRTLKLQQEGKEVTGKYSPGDGKVEGKVKEGVLLLQWKEGGKKGSGRFVMAPDGKGFLGNRNDTDDPDARGPWWNGVRRKPQNFGGTWNMALSDKKNYTLVLQQKGEKVSGTFAPGNGEIEGKIRGEKLSFKFTMEYFDFEGPAKGEGQLKLSDDGQSLGGQFNEIVGPSTGEKTATASRAPARFQGVWTFKSAATGQDLYMKSVSLQQTGDKVNHGAEIGGPIVGDALFFDWDATGLHRNGYFILNPDGKNFTGLFKMDQEPKTAVIPVVGAWIGAVEAGKK